MKIKAVVFDWAGTIVDFGSLAPMGAFVQLFKRHGVAITIEQARQPMGLPKLEHIRALGSMADIATAWAAAHDGEPFNEHCARELHEEFEPMSAQSAWEHRAFIPGFMQTYKALLDLGIRVATTTGYTRKIMQPIIEDAALHGFLPDITICCDDLPRSRPDPMGMWACAKAMDTEPGPHIIKVDDTAPGLLEGLNAGCQAVGVAVSGNALGWSLGDWVQASEHERESARLLAGQKLRLAGAHHVIDSVADLVPFIQHQSD